MPDKDQRYVDAPPYRTATIHGMIPADPIAERLAQLPMLLDVWRVALLGTLTGAALVIGWIELFRRVFM